MPTHPHVLFLMADSLRHDAQQPDPASPLGRLAEGARHFADCYTPSPVCVPARQCMATGKYPGNAGCIHFGEDIAPGSPTFARWFAGHGYYTVAAGKLHHRGPDQMQGWLHRIGSECAVDWPAGVAGREQIGRLKWRGAEDIARSGAGISPSTIHDRLTTRGAIDFLEMHFGGMYPGIDPGTTPLMLMVSLQQPHPPFLAGEDTLGRFGPTGQVPPPDEPEVARLVHERIEIGRDVTAEQADAARAAYFAMIAGAYRQFDEVLQAIGRVGQDIDDWIVVFTSDHGELLGEHSAWGKRLFFEGSAHVPLWIRARGMPPGTDARPASLVDLFPTLCDLAGLPRPAGTDGISLIGDADPDRPIFSQYGEASFMVRRRNLKLVAGPAGENAVLFDLAADPGETRDYSANPAYRDALVQLLADLRAFRDSAHG